MTENFKYGNISETGSAGRVNEDFYGCFETVNGKLFVLCDGAGNPVGGHVASKTAVDAVREFYNTSVYNNPIISIHKALTHANNAVLRKIQEEPELIGMRSTCLIVVVKGNKVYYGSIGHSRLYYYKDGKAFLLAGMPTDEGNIILSEDDESALAEGYLGSAMIDPQICNAPLSPGAGDLLLLCSAGLESVILENFGTPIVYNRKKDLQMRVAELVKLADKNNTADNTTIQLIEFGHENVSTKLEPLPLIPGETVTVQRGVAKSKKAPVVLPLILLLLIAAVMYYGFNYLKKDKTATTVTTATKTDIPPTKNTEISTQTYQDSSLSSALIQAENNYSPDIPVPKNMPQLPPVNPGLFSESATTETVENPIPSQSRMPSGSGDPYIYTIQIDDDEASIKKRFRKSWQQLKGEDYNNTDAVPVPGKEIKIYGYIFMASGSDQERNENIENALKSSPGMQRSQIIVVPGGILIP